VSQDENLAAVVTNAASDIGSFIRSQREAAQVSVRQLAEKAGVSNPYLSQIERGLRKPSADGILEPSETSEVRDAIVNDAAITERQKQVLLDIYTSFCQQNEALDGVDDAEPTDPVVPDPVNAPTPEDSGKDAHHD
jgi:transcriptional regulator with XRE-family HTH domain